MFVPEKNKLNRFKYVAIPKPCELFARYGLMASPATAYSGEQDGAPMQTKIDSLALMDERDKYMQDMESNGDHYEK